MSEPNEDEIVLASAARYLVDGGEEDAASVLLSCSLQFWPSGNTWFVGDETHEALHVKLIGPSAAYDILTDNNQPITQAIQRALRAVLPDNTYIKHFTAHVQHVSMDANWREELLEIARGVGVHNQAAQGKRSASGKTFIFALKVKFGSLKHSTGPECFSFRTAAAGLVYRRVERTRRPTPDLSRWKVGHFRGGWRTIPSTDAYSSRPRP